MLSSQFSVAPGEAGPLIDPEGMVLGVGLRGAELEAALTRALK